MCTIFLLLILSAATAINAEILEEAILKDIFPPSSSKCTSPTGKTNSDDVYESSLEESQWNPDFADYEEHLFLSKMSHHDDNENRTWTIRFGQAGNIYSFVGPMGETVPPQNHDNAPWVDEVWQSVSVDQDENNPGAGTPFFIHESGSYQRDSGYVGVPLTDIPFYSPNLAKHCDDDDGECRFASWGQHGHVPTDFTSGMINMNRYKDCGNGVLEYTTLRHNSFGDPYTMGYLNVPWGGVRHSVLKDVVLTSNSGNDPQAILEPFPSWASSEIRSIGTTLGYSMFVEDLPSTLFNDGDTYPLPIGENTGTQISLTIKQGGCKESKGHSNNLGKTTMYCRLEQTGIVKHGAGDALRFTSSSGNSVVASKGVHHWAWNGNTMYWFPDESPSEVRGKFAVGDTLTVTFVDFGKRAEDNLAMAHVHGTDNSLSRNGGVSRAATRIRTGAAWSRDYTVYTINSMPYIHGGSSYYYRQYFIMDQYTNMDAQGSAWSSEAVQDLYDMNNGPSGRSITLWASYSIFGAVVGDDETCGSATSVCTGSTTPSGTKKPLYQIECGDQQVSVTADPYHYSPSGNPKRPYVCEGLSNERPKWKLLGFFDEDECTVISNGYRYDEEFCSSDPTPGPTSAPVLRTVLDGNECTSDEEF